VRRSEGVHKRALGGAAGKLLRLRHVKHIDRLDAADLAVVIQGVGGDQPDTLLALRDHAASGQPAVERVDTRQIRALAQQAEVWQPAVVVRDDSLMRRLR
jgi:hypothetical protein